MIKAHEIITNNGRVKCSGYASVIVKKLEDKIRFKITPSDNSSLFVEETIDSKDYTSLVKRIKMGLRTFRSGDIRYEILEQFGDNAFIKSELDYIAAEVRLCKITKKDFKHAPVRVLDVHKQNSDLESKLDSHTKHLIHSDVLSVSSCEEYVFRVSDELNLRPLPYIAQFFKATNTCFEKAELLSWDPARVIKAVYLSDDKYFYGFVFPELGINKAPKKLSDYDILKLLDETVHINGAVKFERYCPIGMQKGTCTPFPMKENFKTGQTKGQKEIKKIYVHDLPSLDDQVVDISIGGKGENAHKQSMHLAYGHIWKILSHVFPDYVEKRNLFG